MFALLLASVLSFTETDAALALRTASELVRDCTPRDAGTPSGAFAAHWLLNRASATGATVRRDVFEAPAPDGQRQFVNLYAEFVSDASSTWTVFVSHYDTKPGTSCPGANDGAATSGLLVALADLLFRARGAFGNVLLVWTDAEECRHYYCANDGFQGSRRAVAWIRERKWNVRAVFVLDMLGDRDLRVSLPRNGTDSLSRTVLSAARRIGLSDLVARSELYVKDDHVAFLEAGFPAVDLIDFSYGPDNAWWHAPSDTVDKLSADSLLNAGRLCLELLKSSSETTTGGKP